MSKEVGAGGRFDIFLDSGQKSPVATIKIYCVRLALIHLVSDREGVVGFLSFRFVVV